MPLLTRLRRYGYRCAYFGLRLWWFVARPHVTGVKCVLTSGAHVLLVRHTYGDRRWDLPGGTVKRDEPPEHAARREMAEELGLDVRNWTDLGKFAGWIQYHHDTVHCLQAEVPMSRPDIELAELAEAAWFPRAQLPAQRGRYVERMVALATPTR